MGDGKPVQWSERRTARLVFVGLRGIGHRALGHQRDDRIHARVDSLDPRQMCGHDVARRDLLAPNARGEIDRGQGAELVAGGGSRRRTIGWSV